MYKERLLTMTLSSLKKKELIPNVTFFKGIAIFMVLFVHSTQRFALPVWLKMVGGFGQMGCQIFFVLSAFTLCLSFDRKQTKYFEFLKKRASKFAVPYWTMLAVYAIIRVLVAYRDNESIMQALNLPGILINALFLHGFVPDKFIMNGFVAGGWFLGTVFVLYVLFPLMYKIFNIRNQKWQKHRIWIFPMIAFLPASTILLVAGSLNEGFCCVSNSFTYFSFLNQLTCFCLGFSLFELHKKDLFSKIRCSGIIGCILLVLSFVLFYSNIENIFILLPTLVGIAFLFIYTFFQSNKKCTSFVEKDGNIIVKFFNMFGKNNLYLYLSHPMIMSRLAKIVVKILREIDGNELLWYILLAPVMFGLSYLLAVIFRNYINFIEDFIRVITSKITKKIQRN